MRVGVSYRGESYQKLPRPGLARHGPGPMHSPEGRTPEVGAIARFERNSGSMASTHCVDLQGRLELILLPEAPKAGKPLPLQPGTHSLGSDSACTYHVDTPRVAAIAAKIHIVDGVVRLRPARGQPHILVNGHYARPDSPTLLTDGDSVRVGDCEMFLAMTAGRGALVPRQQTGPPLLVFHQGHHSIGSDPRARMSHLIRGSSIRARHCEINVGQSEATLHRLDPRAEVRLDDRPLAEDEVAALASGQRLILGTRRFVVRLAWIPFSAPTGPTASASNPLPRESSPGLPWRLDRPLRPGDILGKYSILKHVGGDGAAVVYAATPIGQPGSAAVVLKILAVSADRGGVDEQDMAEVERRRLDRMGRISGELANHPGSIRVLEINLLRCRDSIFPFIVMEYVRGTDLRHWIQENGSMALPLAIRVTRQAADWLRFAWTQDRAYVHRDVKPGNMMLTPQGTVKMLDLGFAKATRGNRSSALTPEGFGICSAGFSAPELQQDAASVDHRADIYSLGATLQALVTGISPPKGWPQNTPDTSGELWHRVHALVDCCTQRDPRRRFPNYDLLICELENLGPPAADNAALV